MRVETVDENIFANVNRNRFNSIYTNDKREYINDGNRNSFYGTMDENIFSSNRGRSRLNSIYTNNRYECRNNHQSNSKFRNNSIFTNNSINFENIDSSTIYDNSIFSYYGNDDNKKIQQNSNSSFSPIADVSYEEDSLLLTKIKSEEI
ncbi:hypothetical protein BCR36DRAFT_366870 [Piromyces finnis]|uniref:Uncharacterized protein n=1 Tax=Piromyces finnis TaxID=1754191 RepID=A0A1Y1VLN3_9FUNG|nr:hypothetical protein BCR36DRAFT_366870 [Piromyces finnis]|eukprot:ORX58649.1 hypothetical protein BCR36DRAFT_366870 [Piromyces finnis]